MVDRVIGNGPVTIPSRSRTGAPWRRLLRCPSFESSSKLPMKVCSPRFALTFRVTRVFHAASRAVSSYPITFCVTPSGCTASSRGATTCGSSPSRNAVSLTKNSNNELDKRSSNEGTTWTQEMVWLIVNNCDVITAADVPLQMRAPFLECANSITLL